ncbi:hypothetical protein [Thalassospira marina]|uniref:Mu-like prophage FluMu N-terminal domain-containing protein n=1 Tax=Thalassospira marina TaxID=2048283 RepID=A0A2N3KY32_9PROT|nr:hypothetical protein [Thalassospira marina]PKR55481.1 hypothetical protein COO20_04745 [Thalassospira marina]
MEYPVLIAVDHDGKKYKPGGMVNMTAEQAEPLLRTGFLGTPADDTTSETAHEPASALECLVAAMGKLDPDNADLFTGSGKPKTETLQALDDIDFTVTAALRDQAWDQFTAQA